jgi:hypothetical protein
MDVRIQKNNLKIILLLGMSGFSFRKMLKLQHQHNNHTTTPHMRVDSSVWGPLSCEGLCGYCDGVV